MILSRRLSPILEGSEELNDKVWGRNAAVMALSNKELVLICSYGKLIENLLCQQIFMNRKAICLSSHDQFSYVLSTAKIQNLS